MSSPVPPPSMLPHPFPPRLSFLEGIPCFPRCSLTRFLTQQTARMSGCTKRSQAQTLADRNQRLNQGSPQMPVLAH